MSWLIEFIPNLHSSTLSTHNWLWHPRYLGWLIILDERRGNVLGDGEGAGETCWSDPGHGDPASTWVGNICVNILKNICVNIMKNICVNSDLSQCWWCSPGAGRQVSDQSNLPAVDTDQHQGRDERCDHIVRWHSPCWCSGHTYLIVIHWLVQQLFVPRLTFTVKESVEISLTRYLPENINSCSLFGRNWNNSTVHCTMNWIIKHKILPLPRSDGKVECLKI